MREELNSVRRSTIDSGETWPVEHSVFHEDIRTKPGVTTVRPIHPRWTHAGMQAGLQDVIDSLDAGRPTSSPPESARTTVALIQAILMSQARGNVKVMLEELAPVKTPAR